MNTTASGRAAGGKAAGSRGGDGQQGAGATAADRCEYESPLVILVELCVRHSRLHFALITHTSCTCAAAAKPHLPVPTVASSRPPRRARLDATVPRAPPPHSSRRPNRRSRQRRVVQRAGGAATKARLRLLHPRRSAAGLTWRTLWPRRRPRAPVSHSGHNVLREWRER